MHIRGRVEVCGELHCMLIATVTGTLRVRRRAGGSVCMLKAAAGWKFVLGCAAWPVLNSDRDICI
jgi:hypothetical protein